VAPRGRGRSTERRPCRDGVTWRSAATLCGRAADRLLGLRVPSPKRIRRSRER
jgi:hypothetical protein